MSATTSLAIAADEHNQKIQHGLRQEAHGTTSGKAAADLPPAVGKHSDRDDFGATEVESVDEQAISARDEGDLAFVAEALANRDLADDIRAGAEWNGGSGLYATWEHKVDALAEAYPVALHLIASTEEALKELLKLPPFSDVTRRPSTKNLALFAVRLVAKPGTMSEHKAASEYAALLHWAVADRVPPLGFLDWARQKTLADAKTFVRERRAKKKAAKRGDREEQVLVITMRPPGGPNKHLSLSIDARQQQAILLLADRGTLFSLHELAQTILDLAGEDQP